MCSTLCDDNATSCAWILPSLMLSQFALSLPDTHSAGRETAWLQESESTIPYRGESSMVSGLVLCKSASSVSQVLIRYFPSSSSGSSTGPLQRGGWPYSPRLLRYRSALTIRHVSFVSTAHARELSCPACRLWRFNCVPGLVSSKAALELRGGLIPGAIRLSISNSSPMLRTISLLGPFSLSLRRALRLKLVSFSRVDRLAVLFWRNLVQRSRLEPNPSLNHIQTLLIHLAFSLASGISQPPCFTLFASFPLVSRRDHTLLKENFIT